MIGVGTAAQCRAMDRDAVQRGLPSVTLMEVAALRVAEVVRCRWPDARVVVVTGAGNNGGDGWAIARWLQHWGTSVSVLSAASPAGGDALIMARVAAASGVTLCDSLDGAEVVVDCLLGTGLSRPVQGRFAELVEAINRSKAPVLSVDIPSGLCSDTGAVLGVAVAAQITVSFAAFKPGFFCRQGPAHVGERLYADLGLSLSADGALGQVPRRADIHTLWPVRATDGHKTGSGHLAVVAGSLSMAGAAVLTCRGALAAGVGLLTLIAPRQALVRLSALPSEVMVLPCEAPGELDGLDLSRFTAFAVGPGLGPVSERAVHALGALWRQDPRPALFDADGLVAIDGRGAGERLITPHAAEAARLLGRGVEQVNDDRFGAAAQLAAHGVTALLKGPYTLVASEGRPTSVNTTGNALLSSGGTGDVLTGVVGALLARGLSAYDAAVVGAFVHGLAADQLAASGVSGHTASDVAAQVGTAVSALGRVP